MVQVENEYAGYGSEARGYSSNVSKTFHNKYV